MKLLRTTLTVRGPKIDIERFRDVVRPGDTRCDLSLATLVPIPERHAADPRSPYQLRRDKWGTPWDVQASSLVSASGTQLDYEFKTASSPPLAWLETASAKFPSLEFLLEYEDTLNDTQGSAWAQGGKCH